MIEVKVISTRGQSALIECSKGGKLERKTVPLADIQDGKISEYKLKLGVPYGLEWSKLITLKTTSDLLEQNLRQAGVWTAEDALSNSQRLLSVLQKTYGVDMSTIQILAKQVKKKENK